jgi:hypothetical protein
VPPCSIERTSAIDIRNGRRQLVGDYVVPIQGRSVFDFAPESCSDAVDFRRPPLHLQLSQLKQIHALRTVSVERDSESVPLPYTDADLFETICKIRADEPDDAGTHELIHHIRGTAAPDEQALSSFIRRKLKPLPIWDLWLASEWKQLDAR